MPALNIPYLHVKKLEESRPGVSATILEEGWLDSAQNARENPAMMALMEIYQLLPGDAELKDPSCPMCRGKVLNSFQLMKPYLKQAAGVKVVSEDFRDWSYKAMFEETLNLKV